MDDCIFCKIAKHEEPKEFTYEDEEVMVFPDIHPIRPTHLLIVPKKHYTDLLALDDEEIWNKLKDVAQDMVREFNLTETGFRLTNNGGGAQQIDHFHFHLVGPLGKAI